MIKRSLRHFRPLISLEYVSKSFGDDFLDYEQFVLKNVSLTIQKGEFVIIFGPSGSGKSTLLNLIAGLERPSAGKVRLKRRDLTRMDDDELAVYHRRRMGMVFQNFNLVKSLNVWENVALPQTADGVAIGFRFRRAAELLKLFGLGTYTHRHINELSGGEQQRLAIARALVNNPLLLLVDEPTGNLDSKSADDVMRLLHGLHYHAHHTILLVTHNPDYLHYATRVIYLQDGEVKKQEWIKSQPRTVPKLLPDSHYVQLSKFKREDKFDGSLADAEVHMQDALIGSPLRPAGIGAKSLSQNQPTLPLDATEDEQRRLALAVEEAMQPLLPVSEETDDSESSGVVLDELPEYGNKITQLPGGKIKAEIGAAEGAGTVTGQKYQEQRDEL